MGLEMRVLLVLAMAICLPSAAYAAEGTATFYTPPYVQERKEYGLHGCYLFFKLMCKASLI
ncbi:EG45-like domain containing protein [Prunus yedoensis var. nudiflora]|uniref:EG45-like domain containing protein n=1 Tax=Prunus yedoensis var. nudiflora TaxID=2094558 RepID=A0A314YW99_PRUYE|nr:EG45-like domain containing protein [Prunus yedoensis var. nudiflora]